MWLDKFTIRNLELIAPQQDGGTPLIEVLDHTLTAMGSRLLRKWMVLPLKERELIQERLTVVDIFYKDSQLLEKLTGCIRHIADLERLISRLP